jgi:hypothetical protein
VHLLHGGYNYNDEGSPSKLIATFQDALSPNAFISTTPHTNFFPNISGKVKHVVILVHY